MADQKLTALTELTTIDGSDLLYVIDDTIGTPLGKKITRDNLLKGGILDNNKFVCNGRLTLTTGTPVTTADVTDAVTLYFTPYNGNEISLYNGTNWIRHEFTEISLALGALTASKPYDIFAYSNSGTVTLEGLVWTNDTTRATALAYQDGVYVKTGATTRRYLGTIYITADQNCDDALIFRGVWNMYNRVPRRVRGAEGTAHTYETGTGRKWNNSTGTDVYIVLGYADEILVYIKATLKDGATIYLGYDATLDGWHSAIAEAGSAYESKYPQAVRQVAAGIHSFYVVEYGGAGADFDDAEIGFVYLA